MALALFDLDNTLLAGDSDHLWGQFLSEHRLVDTEIYRQANERYYLDYKNGTLDIHEFVSFVLKPLAGKRPEDLKALHDRYMDEKIRPILLGSARQLLARHRAQGDTLVIITATNSFVTGPIAAEYGVEHLIATEPELLDGHYTGRGQGIPCFQSGKVDRLQQWLAEHPQHSLDGSYFYSDSHNDLPLLRAVSFPVAVDPDERLAAEAERQGWPILSLRN